MYLTAWKMSVFGVFLVRIFPHSGWIRRFTQSECGKIRTRKTPNTDTFYAVFNSNPFHAKCLNFILPGNLRKPEMVILGDIERKNFIKNVFTCYCKPLYNKIAPFWNVCTIKFCTIFSWFSGLFNCIACKRLPGQILRNIFFAGTLYLTY